MNRKDLAQLPTPRGTDTWTPVPHIELIKTLDKVLKKDHIGIKSEQFSVGRSGKMLFGVINLDYQFAKGGDASIGIRQANNRRLSIQVCAGFKVTVCDNMVFRGDMIALKRRHTGNLDIEEEMIEAVEKVKIHFGLLKKEIQALQDKTITDSQAKVTIHDVFAGKLMPIRLLPDVSRHYFTPPHKEFEKRTMWSLHNAFTEAAKDMPMISRIESTQRIGSYFGMNTK